MLRKYCSHFYANLNLLESFRCPTRLDLRKFSNRRCCVSSLQCLHSLKEHHLPSTRHRLADDRKESSLGHKHQSPVIPEKLHVLKGHQNALAVAHTATAVIRGCSRCHQGKPLQRHCVDGQHATRPGASMGGRTFAVSPWCLRVSLVSHPGSSAVRMQCRTARNTSRT